MTTAENLTVPEAPWRLPVGPWDPSRLPPIEGDPRIIATFVGGPPPVGRMLRGRISEVWADRVVFSSLPSEWLVGPRGVVPLGVLAVFLDAALGLSSIGGDVSLYPSTVALEMHALRRPAAGPVATHSEG